MCDNCLNRMLRAGTTTHYTNGATKPKAPKKIRKISSWAERHLNMYHWMGVVAFYAAIAALPSILQLIVEMGLFGFIGIAAAYLSIKYEEQNLIKCSGCHNRVEVVHGYYVAGVQADLCCLCAENFHDFILKNDIKIFFS